MCDEFQKALATYDQQMEGLDFHTQCEEARLAHLMDEEAYRKNLVDEARKECELVQNEMDQLESEVDSTVQMCMDQVEKEAELEGLLKETTARCAQAGEHLDQAKDDVLRQSNVLKEIDEELKQISAPVVDTTVADKAIDSVREVVSMLLQPQLMAMANSKEFLCTLREREKAVAARQKSLEAKRNELREAEAALERKRKTVDAEKEDVIELQRQLKSINDQLAHLMEQERNQNQTNGALEKRSDELDSLIKEVTVELEEKTAAKEALQAEASQLKVAIEEFCKESEAKKKELLCLLEARKMSEIALSEKAKEEREIVGLEEDIEHEKVEISRLNEEIAVCRMLLDKRSESEIRKKEVEDLQKEYNESTALQSRLTDELQQKRADLQQLEAEIIMRDQNFRTRQRAIEDEMLSLQDEINTLEEEHRRELAAAEADEHELEALKKKVLQLREDEQSMGGAKRAVNGEVGKSNTYEEHKGIREANGAVPNAQPTFCFATEGNPEKKPPAKAARQLQLDSVPATDSGFSSAVVTSGHSAQLKEIARDQFRNVKDVANLFGGMLSVSTGSEEDFWTRGLMTRHAAVQPRQPNTNANMRSEMRPTQQTKRTEQSSHPSQKQLAAEEHKEEAAGSHPLVDSYDNNSLSTTLFNDGDMVTSTPMLQKMPSVSPRSVRKNVIKVTLKGSGKTKKQTRRVKRPCGKRGAENKNVVFDKKKDVFDLDSETD